MSEQYENNLTIELEAPPLASLIDYVGGLCASLTCYLAHNTVLAARCRCTEIQLHDPLRSGDYLARNIS